MEDIRRRERLLRSEIIDNGFTPSEFEVFITRTFPNFIRDPFCFTYEELAEQI